MEALEKKRIEWIDLLRGFSILCIVFGHVIVHSDKLTPIYRYLNSFHVPIFFVISGYLFNINKEKKFKEFFVAKLKRIMIPYFIFATLYLIPYFIFGNAINENLYGDAKTNFIKPLFGIIYGNGHNSLLQQNSALWFLPCLFIVELICFAVEKIKITKFSEIKTRKFYAVNMIIFFVLGFLNYKIKHVRLPWGIDIALVMMTYAVLGKILRNHLEHKNTNLCIAIAFIVLGIIINLFNGEIACMKHEYSNYILFIISGISTCIGLTLLFSKINKNKSLKYLGKNTMGILIFHKIVIVVIQTKMGLISKILKNGNVLEQIIMSIITLMISIIASLIFTIITRRIMPIALGEKRIRRTTF